MLKKILAVIISIILVINVILIAMQVINFWIFLGVLLLAYLYLKFLQPRIK